MRVVKKIFNIVMILAIIMTTFMPPFALRVSAEEPVQETQPVNEVDMSKKYILYMYYADDGAYIDNYFDGKKVAIGSFDTYTSAKEEMNKIDSKAYATAGIEEDGIPIDIDYAVVYMDQPRGGGRVNLKDYEYFIHQSPENVYITLYDSGISVGGKYVNGPWGADAAFLEYNDTYKAYKIKISGLVGWVKREYVSLHPTSALYGSTRYYPNNRPKIRITATDNLILRKGAGTNFEQVCTGCVATPGSVYEYTPYKTINDGTYSWYYVKIGDKEGYIASLNKNWVDVENTFLNNTYYYVNNNNLYHYIHMGLKHYDYSSMIGEAPFYYPIQGQKQYYLRNNNSYVGEIWNGVGYQNITTRYYSFDSNYFYDDYGKMLEDYRLGEYKNAINYENPYYAYFMYVPSRTKSKATVAEVDLAIASLGYTSNLTHEASYYQFNDEGICTNCGNESILYGKGSSFVEIANRYGINPFSVLDSAIRESGNGRSKIAIVKKNLFGYGASADNPYVNAHTYETIEASIEKYVQEVAGTGGYTNIYDWRYYGTHKGNKLSGVFGYYMTDPYASENDASSSYKNDKNQNLGMIYYNTLGIKNNTDLVKIYKAPSMTSAVIYETRNYATNVVLSNMPFIVLDKVYTYENGKKQGYYKVQTDISLDSNQNYVNTIYNFDNSYGYIKEEDLYVQNHQPIIEAEDITITQLETIDLRAGITASDFEDGDLTAKVKVSGEVDTNVIGTYEITYTVSDSNNFNVTKKINIIVNPTNAPIIKANSTEIPQNKIFDPKVGVTVYDNNEGDITSSLEVVENTVNIAEIGEYRVKYRATNEAGITSEKIRTIRVVANKKPVINSDDTITKYLNDSFDYLEHVTATDFEDGDLTNQITVTSDVNTQIAGNYTITCKVKDAENQEVTKNISVVVEEKPFIARGGELEIDKLLYNEDTQKVDIEGFLLMKEKNINSEAISYSIIFENQQSKRLIIKNLSRMLENKPAAVLIDGYSNEWAWFKQELDLSDIPNGDYNIYIRARSTNYEVKVNLYDNKVKLSYENSSRKFEIDGKGFEFRKNINVKDSSFQLFVREDGLLGKRNNPTYTDNMFNQVKNISLDGTNLNIVASSYNIKANYAVNTNIERTVTFENIETFEKYLTTDVGSITDGISIYMRDPDGFDKTRAWYNKTIDISSLPYGTYSIIVRTKSNEADDYGELYDRIFLNILSNPITTTVGNKRITIERANENLRFRIELKIEQIN